VPPGPAGRYGVHCLPSGPGVSPSASPLAPTLGVINKPGGYLSGVNVSFELEQFQLAKDWIPQLWARLLEIRAERKLAIDSLAEFFGDPLSLAKYYVEPDCQQVNPVDYAEDEAIVREPIFHRIETFISGDPLRTNNQLFILSDAGMGKTSALLMLKLAHLTSFWPQRYKCELLKLGRTTLDDINNLQSKRDTVLLLDALDEDPTAWGRVSARLAEVLAASKPFRRVVITCRTHFFEARHDPFNKRGQVEVAGYICPVVYASLLTDHQVDTYIKRRFPDHYSEVEWRKRAYDIVNKMGFLRMRPMLLAHLDDLLESDETIWNEYSIYRALIQSWLLREQRKSGSSDPDYATKLKNACRQGAVKMHATGRRYFTRYETDMLNRLASAGEVGTIADLGGRSLLNKDSDGNFRFSHYSIQEFLVVEHLIATKKTDPAVEDIRITDFMNKLGIAWLLQAPVELRKNRELRFLTLRDHSMEGVDLSHTRFSKFNMSGANLAGANFSFADLSGSDLSSCDLTGANLQGANLTGSILIAARLNNANLAGASLCGSKLLGADLTSALLDGSNLIDASYDDQTTWDPAVNPQVHGAKLVLNTVDLRNTRGLSTLNLGTEENDA
jgi:uncharacterized protein YjbI with pentapeptide repeats